MSTAAISTLLNGVWEIRHIPLEGGLERLNLTQVSPRLYLGELHPQEGSTWAKGATHEYRVEFTGEGSSGVMSTRPIVAGEEWEKGAWEVYCPFHFQGPVEGQYMSSQGGCAWSVKAVDAPHPVRTWTLSRGGAGDTEPTFHTASWRAPVTNFLGLTSKWQQYLSIGALVAVQFGVRYFFKRFMNAPPAAAPASAADARAAAARVAARGKLSASAAVKVPAPEAAAAEETPSTNSLENKKDL